MQGPWLLSEALGRCIEPHFPLSHGIAWVDERRVIGGIVFIVRNGLRWRAGATSHPASWSMRRDVC